MFLNKYHQILARIIGSGKRRPSRKSLPADIYHLYLMARHIDFSLMSITLFLSNVHIYENNLSCTRRLLAGEDAVKFELRV